MNQSFGFHPVASVINRVFGLQRALIPSFVATLCLSVPVQAAVNIPAEWVGEKVSIHSYDTPLVKQDIHEVQLQQKQLNLSNGQHQATFFTGSRAFLSIGQYSRRSRECALFSPSSCIETSEGEPITGNLIHLRAQAIENQLTISGGEITGAFAVDVPIGKIVAAESTASNRLDINNQYHYSMNRSLNEGAWKVFQFMVNTAKSGYPFYIQNLKTLTESSANDNQLSINGGQLASSLVIAAATVNASNVINTKLGVSGDMTSELAFRPSTFTSALTVHDGLKQSEVTADSQALRNTTIISGGNLGEVDLLSAASVESFNVLESYTKTSGVMDGDTLKQKAITLKMGAEHGLNVVLNSRATVSGNRVNLTGGQFDAIDTIAAGYAQGGIKTYTQLSNDWNIFGEKEHWFEDFLSEDTFLTNDNLTENRFREGGIYSITLKEGNIFYTPEGSSLYPMQSIVELTANDNNVNISGVQVKNGINSIYGAYLSADVRGLGEETVTSYVFNAQNNQINLATDEAINHTVAGAAITWRDNIGYAINAQVTGNNLIISQAPRFGSQSIIAGGVVLDNDDDVDLGLTFKTKPHKDIDLFTNNTLNLVNYTGTSTIGHVGNFEYYQFDLPKSFKPNESVALRAKNVYLDNPHNPAQHAAIGAVEYEGNIAQLKQNDALFLIKADTLHGSLANEGEVIDLKQGVTLEVPTVVTTQDNTIKLVVRDRLRASESSKILSEGFLSSALLNIRAGDVVAHSGVAEAERAVVGVQEARSIVEGVRAFAVMGGSAGRHMSPSHIDMNSGALLAGAAWGKTSANGRLTLGGFVETGRGNYDARQRLSDGNKVDGSGKAHYLGGGVLARFNWNSGLYAEASLRAGRMHNRFNSNLRDVAGEAATYALSTPYYGAHVGVGHVWKMTDKVSMDVYGKYLFARQNGKDVRLSTEDELSFKAVNSHRMQVGARISGNYGRANLYAGLGYEHEFSAKATATTYGLPIDAPSVRGGSGIGEIGILVTPTAKSGWGVEASLRGYVGKRQEVSGAIRVSYSF